VARVGVNKWADPASIRLLDRNHLKMPLIKEWLLGAKERGAPLAMRIAAAQSPVHTKARKIFTGRHVQRTRSARCRKTNQERLCRISLKISQSRSSLKKISDLSQKNLASPVVRMDNRDRINLECRGE